MEQMPATIQTEASVAESCTQATSQLSQRSMQSGLAKNSSIIGRQLWASQRESMILPTGAPRIPATLLAGQSIAGYQKNSAP